MQVVHTNHFRFVLGSQPKLYKVWCLALFTCLYFVEVAVLKTNLLNDEIKYAKIIKYVIGTPLEKTQNN